MRLYKVHGGVMPHPVYAGSNTDAVAIRLDVFRSGKGVKKSDILIEPVEVPTDKAGLIAFLNGAPA